MQRYVFPTRVRSAGPRTRPKSVRKEGNDVKIEYERLGYFVVLDGFTTAFRVGDEDPGVRPGAIARLIIEIDD